MLALPEQTCAHAHAKYAKICKPQHAATQTGNQSQKSELFVVFFGEKQLEHDHLLAQAPGALMSMVVKRLLHHMAPHLRLPLHFHS